MISIFSALFYWLILIFFHEFFHILSSLILKRRIIDYGIKFIPYPHFFVETEWINNKIHRFFFFITGFISTSIIFFLMVVMNFFDNKYFYYASIFQLTIETNPLYSDFIFIILFNKHKSNQYNFDFIFYSEMKKFIFSLKWYLFFICWLIFIYYLCLLNPFL